jgi:tetratricopeptide (TPR) repeat protein
MAEESHGAVSSQTREEVRGAISAFEQILEVLPNDLASLESLWRAYSELGEDDKAITYLLRLGRALEEDNDAVTAARVLAAVRGAGYDDPRIDQLVSILGEMSGDRGSAQPAAASLRTHVNVADELSFAWYMLESELVTRDEYARAAEALAEMSAQGQLQGTVSLLHALETQNFTRMEHLLEAVSASLQTPFVSLTSFDIGLDTARLLPLDFMRGRGVMPFEVLDRNVLIAVLNPHDAALREEINEALGRRCHFFLASAQEFDQAVANVTERLAAAQS